MCSACIAHVDCAFSDVGGYGFCVSILGRGHLSVVVTIRDLDVRPTMTIEFCSPVPWKAAISHSSETFQCHSVIVVTTFVSFSPKTLDSVTVFVADSCSLVVFFSNSQRSIVFSCSVTLRSCAHSRRVLSLAASIPRSSSALSSPANARFVRNSARPYLLAGSLWSEIAMHDLCVS